jgi:asparagine synthase (glutamine-hydrolysing)
MSMAHSLEVRVPYLDHCWIEFVVSLPDGFIFDGKNQKRLLKEIGSKFLPPEVYGPKKGFVLPIGTWLKDKLRSRVQETLSRQKMKRRGLFDSDYIAKKMAAFFSGQGDWQPIWSFFVLESWMEQNDVSL